VSLITFLCNDLIFIFFFFKSQEFIRDIKFLSVHENSARVVNLSELTVNLLDSIMNLLELL